MWPIRQRFLLAALLMLAAGSTNPRPTVPAQGSAPMQQEIWYHTGYPGGVIGPDRGMSALTGPTKMPAIFEAIVQQRLVEPGAIHTDSPLVNGRSPSAPPIDLESLRAVHTDQYIKAILTGEPRALATSQGLPTWTEDIARGWLLNVGGLFAAAEAALHKRTITGNLGQGYHHASVDRGMGFCTINGLVVVAKKLIRQRAARRIMIVDLDHHEGNGTAELIIGDERIWNVSIYGSYMGGPPAARNNHVLRVDHEAVDLGPKRDANYLAAISGTLPPLLHRHHPDLILYQAGMDPYDGAGISPAALAIRDAYVFALARTRSTPVVWALAGGYADLHTLVRLHTQTARMANEVLAHVAPANRIQHTGTDPYRWEVSAGLVRFPDWLSSTDGPPRVGNHDLMSDAEAREFAAARERLRQEQRLPEEEVVSAYHRLVSPLR